MKTVFLILRVSFCFLALFGGIYKLFELIHNNSHPLINWFTVVWVWQVFHPLPSLTRGRGGTPSSHEQTAGQSPGKSAKKSINAKLNLLSLIYGLKFGHFKPKLTLPYLTTPSLMHPNFTVPNPMWENLSFHSLMEIIMPHKMTTLLFWLQHMFHEMAAFKFWL